ncbi:hypothetical protein DT076_16585 [Desertihabitans brevis]|uniref:Uncharacterized protein n=1 Tax=Desertihabitans brevis TaxID=2268447 RepID=A0A367YQV1_9ACTN|nr:hypothetical protein [Desertihabitans brevis]RCK68265.1 hypothetical protein DT076_16585 [Desertihabitans brevis]
MSNRKKLASERLSARQRELTFSILLDEDTRTELDRLTAERARLLDPPGKKRAATANVDTSAIDALIEQAEQAVWENTLRMVFKDVGNRRYEEILADYPDPDPETDKTGEAREHVRRQFIDALAAAGFQGAWIGDEPTDDTWPDLADSLGFGEMQSLRAKVQTLNLTTAPSVPFESKPSAKTR